MKTAFYEADPFGGSKGKHYLTIDSDYRWEKGALTASNVDTLEDWYLPKWREQGWTDSGDAGVLEVHGLASSSAS